MFPILYDSVSTGSIPENKGLGTLSDAISCVVEQERNGIYELTMEYAESGIHAEELALRRIIKVKPNFTDPPQLFRIDRIGKVMNGVFTIYAKHISYDLSGVLISSGTASSASAACLLLQNAATGYTITTDKTATGNFSITEPSSVRSWFGGKEGSFLDVFGTAEIVYNNFNIQFKLHAGQDRGVTIRYGKNLLELSQEVGDSVYTHVVAFYKDENTMVVGSKISTGLTLDVEKTKILDVSGDYEEPPTSQQLTTKAQNYINNNNLTTPSNNITLDFVQSGELTNRVDLCDTVTVYYEALGISRTQVKCIRTKWDCIREKYIETEFGDATGSLADSIIETNRAIAEKPSTSFMDSAIRNATQLITGNLGGYVVLHDSNGDGEPDEILIMNTPDISTATAVWRWNKNGLGYATSYDGEYGLAMTSDGAIVADFITTGELSGNRVRTGVIASQNNQLIMDLDNGTITAPSITLNGEDVGSTLDSLVQTSVVTRYALSNSGTIIPSVFPLTDPTQPTDAQPYLWSKTTYTYANGQSNITYGVSVKGEKGADGADGQGIEILGSYDTMADLIAAHPTGSAGDAYMVGTDLVVWDTTNSQWKDVGRIQGANGADGLWLAIDNDDDGTLSNVTYNAHLLRGNSDVTTLYHSIFAWYLVKEAGITEIATGTSSITVTRDSADYGATIRCVCIAIVEEEDMEDYTYVPITDYDGNIIQIIGSNNVKLIGDSAIYKPYAISSQFQVLSDEISSRVTQTDFNSLSGTVTQQGTLIQQNAQQILLKANTSTVNTQLNGKMGTDMSNRASSILIDSGQIRFDSNSLIVNSSQFTLDANGNAAFGGNISAATLNIGGSAVGVGTAINNAQSNAIATSATDATNKANAALSSANSYTNTGLSGKVGNNEIRTKFAADTHSVTITSGTIAFNSNTLSVNATNLTVTNDGLVTAKKFKARDEFSLQDASGNSRGYFKYPSTGTHFALLNNSAQEVAEMWVYNSSGRFQFKNASQVPTIYGYGDTGNFVTTGTIVCGGITAKTQIVAKDNSNNTRVFFNATSYGYGSFKNSSGDNNIYLRGDSGNIEIAGRVIQGSSRKIKKNIEPIEDSEKILELQAVSFDYINEEVGTDRRGFIAEDVAEVLPNLVQPESEGHNASLDYIGMIPYLQDIIKKQEERIKTLEEKIDKLMEKEK